MNVAQETTNVYRLGDIEFGVTNASQDLKAALQQLFEPSDSLQHEVSLLEESTDIRAVVNSLLSRYCDCIWIDAASLICPGGKRFIISGNSGTGKSTTALALVYGNGWKLLSEDITLIDHNRDKIISFPSPFSLKAGTAERVKSACGVSPGPLIHNEWVRVPNDLIAASTDAGFDTVIHFAKNRERLPLSCTPISEVEYVRLILECSNLIHMDEAPDLMVKYTKGAARYLLNGGTLDERLEFIQSLVQN